MSSSSPLVLPAIFAATVVVIGIVAYLARKLGAYWLRVAALALLGYVVYHCTAELATVAQALADAYDVFLLFLSRWGWGTQWTRKLHICDPRAWTVFDSLQIILFLWLHEARCITAAIVVYTVDMLYTAIRGQPRSHIGALFDLMPSSVQWRTAIISVMVLMLGVDITTSLERFAAFSMRRPLEASTPSVRWDSMKSAAKNGTTRDPLEVFEVYAKDSLTGRPPPPEPRRIDPFDLGGGHRYVASNARLECELRQALRRPGVLIISGARNVGKSMTLKKLIRHFGGYYCDVHAASSPRGLEALLDSCSKPHRLATTLWAPISNVVTAVSVTIWAWLPSDHFSWINVMTGAIEYAATTPRGSRSDEAFKAYLPECFDALEREDGADDAERFTASGASGGATTGTAALGKDRPMVVVLDGVRDIAGSSPLSMLEQTTAAMRFVRSAAKHAVVVIVAATDHALTIDALLGSEINGIATNLQFVNAAPPSLIEVAPVYRRVTRALAAAATIVTATSARNVTDGTAASPGTRQCFDDDSDHIDDDEETETLVPPPPPPTDYGCDKLVHCALNWFGGNFEHLNLWLTSIGEISTVKVPSAADCDGAALAVLLKAKRTVADALHLRDHTPASDHNMTFLGEQLRAIRLAARLANAEILSALEVAARPPRAVSNDSVPNEASTNAFDVASDKSRAASALQLKRLSPKLKRRNGHLLLEDVDLDSAHRLLARQIAVEVSSNSIQCQHQREFAASRDRANAVADEDAEDAERLGVAVSVWSAREEQGPRSKPFFESNPLRDELLARLALSTPRLTLAAPFYRFAISRLLLSYSETIRSISDMYVARSVTEAARRPTQVACPVTMNAERLAKAVKVALDDLSHLVEAEALSSDCLAGIAADWHEPTL